MQSPDASSGHESGARQSAKRKPLYARLYFDPLYIELARFIGYDGKPIAEAMQFVLQLEKKYGRDKVIEAREALSSAEGKQESLVVRLTAEARRLAWQLLGPPPEPADTTAENMAVDRLKGDQNTADKPKKLRKKKAPATPATGSNEPTKNAGSREGNALDKGEQLTREPRNPQLMQQYREAKERHPGMMLLFRLGDFYELFDEDAQTAARLLGLALTIRDGTTSMAGFPHHCLENHLRKLLQAGQRVAVCDQELPTRPARKRPEQPADTQEAAADVEETRGKNVRLARREVLDHYLQWLQREGLTFLVAHEAQQKISAQASLGTLDFVVHQDGQRLLVTVRSSLRAKERADMLRWQEAFDADYTAVRVWPIEGKSGWTWKQYAITPDRA